jgi:hypothetical protein
MALINKKIKLHPTKSAIIFDDCVFATPKGPISAHVKNLSKTYVDLRDNLRVPLVPHGGKKHNKLII